VLNGPSDNVDQETVVPVQGRIWQRQIARRPKAGFCGNALYGDDDSLDRFTRTLLLRHVSLQRCAEMKDREDVELSRRRCQLQAQQILGQAG
jgi:hypothetical protein